MKIRDSVALGTVAGLIGSIPQLIFDSLTVLIGYKKYYGIQLTGSVYLVRQLTDDPLGLIIGGIIWEILAASLGVITVYVIRFTGKDYWWLKGLMTSFSIMFITVYGFVYNIGGAKIVPFDIKTNFTVLLGTILFGLTMSYIIVHWGELEV